MDAKIVVASIRDCIDRQMLFASVKMSKILEASSVEQSTPKRVEKWFKDALNFASQDLSERIDAVRASVKYVKVTGDPAGSALTFCMNVMKSLSTNVTDDVLKIHQQACREVGTVLQGFARTHEEAT